MRHVRNQREFRRYLALDRLVEIPGVERRRANVAVTDIQQDRNVGLVGVLHRVHALDGAALQDPLQAVVAPAHADLGQVGNRGPRDRAAVGTVGAHHGRGGGESAVGIAENGQSLRIGDALLDQPGRAIVLVVLHLLAPLRIAGHPVLAAEVGRATVLRTQDCVPARGQERHPSGTVPARIVARPGATVRVDDGGQGRVALFPAGWQVQDCRDAQAVTCGVFDPALLADLFRVEPGALAAQGDDSLAIQQEVISRWVAMAFGSEQHPAHAVVVVAQHHALAREILCQQGVHGGHVRIDIGHFGIGAVDDIAKHPPEVAGLPAEDQASDGKFRMCQQGFAFEFAGRGVVHPGLDKIGEQVGQHVELAALFVDADDVDGVALGDLAGQGGMHHELAACGVSNQHLLLVFAAGDRLQLGAGEQFAVARVEQAGTGTSAALEQQLGLARAKVVQHVVAAERSGVELADDDVFGVERQGVDQ